VLIPPYRQDFVNVVYGNVNTVINTVLKNFSLEHLSKTMSKLREFKNIHEGERCFIVCTGPSLTKEDVDLLMDEYTFGVNSIFHIFDKTTWRPQYYVMCDAVGYQRQNEKWDFSSVCTKKAFLNARIIKKEKLTCGKIVGFVFNHRTSEYYKSPSISMRSEPNIDICIYDRCTVTNVAIDIALYMGFKEIYLLGVDHDYSRQKHFVELTTDRLYGAPSDYHMRLSEVGYCESKTNAERHNAVIYNATRGGKLDVFERVNLEDII